MIDYVGQEEINVIFIKDDSARTCLEISHGTTRALTLLTGVTPLERDSLRDFHQSEYTQVEDECTETLLHEETPSTAVSPPHSK